MMIYFLELFPAFLFNLFIFKEKIKRISVSIRAIVRIIGYFIVLYLINGIVAGYLKSSPFDVFTVAYMIKKNSITFINIKTRTVTRATTAIPVMF
jgi:hypothetical protein